MDLNVEEFVDGLFSDEAFQEPSDTGKPEQVELELPKWFDENKFNQARRFFWDHCFMLTTTMLLGLVAVFAVPSILKVLIGSHRSSSTYTAYKRYLSTLLHTVSWFEHELKPNSKSWKSLYAVRSRHLRASIAGKLTGVGIVSQRDIALTQFGFIGFAILKPDKFGIRQLEDGDWEAYNHFWRTIGHMIGLQDRYNICRSNIAETRAVCQILLDRVYTPCLENVPEYFEHMARVMLEGMENVNPMTDVRAVLYYCRHLADVPGYVYSENDRIQLKMRLREQLQGKSDESSGIDSTTLMQKPAIGGLQAREEPRLLHLEDYGRMETVPEYKLFNFAEKYKLAVHVTLGAIYSINFFRIYLNLVFHWSLLLMKYFPYVAFFKYGIRKSYVNIFKESPTDDTKPKVNAKYYKPQPPVPWYKQLISILW